MIEAANKWLFILFANYILLFWVWEIVDIVEMIAVKIWHFIKDLSKRSNRK